MNNIKMEFTPEQFDIIRDAVNYFAAISRVKNLNKKQNEIKLVERMINFIGDSQDKRKR